MIEKILCFVNTKYSLDARPRWPVTSEGEGSPASPRGIVRPVGCDEIPAHAGAPGRADRGAAGESVSPPLVGSTCQPYVGLACRERAVVSDLRDRVQSMLGTAYSVERELAGGGMSRVFVATETALAATQDPKGA